MQKKALIVDDNADYVKFITSHLKPMGYQFDHAWDAKEGLDTLDIGGFGYYELIVTDISMENQTSGLKVVRQLKRVRFRGIVMVASTGFNTLFVRLISHIYMKWLRVDIMIPKRPLKKGVFQPIPISHKGRIFMQTRKNSN